ncbi:glycosyltransferase [Laspinema sp. D1]|uniref:Glycosyltransferase n=1 Tax=Laspinema palackyanum D2a TaxID=2953684 RepID=A0ABT2MMH3_9CYAN|nr:glycosyltransferase [Laspinema sp. D2a]
MKIALMLGKFPALSETYILNQITGLISRGHEVDIYADEPGETSKVHPDVEKYNLLDKTRYAPLPAKKVIRTVKGSKILLAHGYKSPMTLLRSLNLFKYNYFKHRDQGYFLRLLYSAIPLLDQPAYDIIHCHFAPYGLRGVLLREIGAIQGKIITTFHGFDVNLYPRQTHPKIYQDLFQKGDLYTANTPYTASKAVALGCPPDKILTLPMGINLSHYTFRPPTLGQGESVKIMTVARLVEKKGIEYSLKAVAKVLEHNPNLEYRIVGDGPLRGPLEHLIGELGIAEKVQLLGWKTQEELFHLYDSSHIFLLSSVTAADGDQEGQGLVLQEAQARGLPVLSTLHNGIPEGILEGKSGFLVPERDVEALAEKLSYLVEHPEVWPQMGKAGRTYMEEGYDINKLNDRLVEIYQQLLGSS